MIGQVLLGLKLSPGPFRRPTLQRFGGFLPGDNKRNVEMTSGAVWAGNAKAPPRPKSLDLVNLVDFLVSGLRFGALVDALLRMLDGSYRGHTML